MLAIGQHGNRRQEHRPDRAVIGDDPGCKLQPAEQGVADDAPVGILGQQRQNHIAIGPQPADQIGFVRAIESGGHDGGDVGRIGIGRCAQTDIGHASCGAHAANA